MDKCRLCQQIHNNLTIIHSNRLKSLSQIILKLKGFKDSRDVNTNIAICDNCIKSLENVACFWENIPEAKRDADELAGDLKHIPGISHRTEPNLPALTLQSENDQKPFSSAEKNHEPIKLLIKCPRKRKIKVTSKTKNTSVDAEPLQKRTRRCPQRYDDFQLTDIRNTSAASEKTTILLSDSDAYNEICFADLPQVALLRLENSQNIGTLAEAKSKTFACKIRISCKFCCQVFRCERIFQNHIKSHLTTCLQQSEENIANYLYHCILCDKPFSNHRAVRNHFKLGHSQERYFKCLHCEASFKYKFNLNYHMSTKHVSKKRFECAFCKKMFFMRYELQIHIRTHTKERPYKCEFCSFASAHQSNLKTHQRVKHFENSTETTFLQVFDNSKKSKILTGQFMPPENLIQQKEEPLNNISKSVANLTPLKDVVNLEESSEQRNEPHSNENTIFEYDSINLEQIKLSEAVLEHGNTPNLDFSNRNNSNSAILTTFEGCTENLEEHLETAPTEMIYTYQGCENTNIQSDSIELPNLAENKVLEITTANESSEEFLKSQPILGVFQLDSSLLKVLPSTSILGLKKWTKYFQSTPENQLQLVKSSTFVSNKNVNKVDINKILRDCKGKSEITAENSTDTKSYFAISSQFVDNSDSNVDNLNLATKNIEVSKAEEKVINISKPAEPLRNNQQQNYLRDAKKFETYEINSNKSCENVSLKVNASQPWKDIKVSSRPIKIKYITNSKHLNNTSNKSHSSINTQAGLKNFTSKKISANEPIAKVTTNSNKNLRPNSMVTNSSSNSQSLLKPVIKVPQTAPLTFTSPKVNQTLLHNKPLITKIEILPPLKMLTTLQKSPTNLIKPPVEYKFQCPYCYKYFKQKSPLTKHLRTHTGEKPYKCNLCPRTYADASNYKKHKILHKNAAEALNISRKTPVYVAQSSPAYSTVSDPDPDGIEIMQTLKKFECSSTEDDNDDSDSSNIESQMWHDALDQALNSEQIRENIRTNLMGINNSILPKLI